VLYITDRGEHFETLGTFWIHALFKFLEDRFEVHATATSLDSEALISLATASDCREASAREVIQAIQTRLGRPLDDTERVAMHIGDEAAGLRVFAMLASEDCWAALFECEARCVGAFVADPPGAP
jgi:hypothetical protein